MSLTSRQERRYVSGSCHLRDAGGVVPVTSSPGPLLCTRCTSGLWRSPPALTGRYQFSFLMKMRTVCTRRFLVLRTFHARCVGICSWLHDIWILSMQKWINCSSPEGCSVQNIVTRLHCSLKPHNVDRLVISTGWQTCYIDWLTDLLYRLVDTLRGIPTSHQKAQNDVFRGGEVREGERLRLLNEYNQHLDWKQIWRESGSQF